MSKYFICTEAFSRGLHQSVPKREWIAELSKESRILKINAHQKPSICIPTTILSATSITKALITKEKKPNVRKLIGKPKNFNTGVKKVLRSPKTTAKTKVVGKSLK